MLLTKSEALHEAATAEWAYADIEGNLRCPDCNSDADHMGTATFHEVEAHGAVIVSDDDECVDCGTILIEDGGCPPWTLRTPLESCWWGDGVTDDA